MDQIPAVPPRLAGWTAVIALALAVASFGWRLLEYRASRRRAVRTHLYQDLRGDAEQGFEEEVVVLDIQNVGVIAATVLRWQLQNDTHVYYSGPDVGHDLHDVRIEPGSHAQAVIDASDVWRVLGTRQEIRADVWILGGGLKHSTWLRPTRYAEPFTA